MQSGKLFSDNRLNARQSDKRKSRVTIFAALINLFLSIIKIGFGIVGQSTALIADGIHSLSDLVSDAFVFIAIKLGSRKADHDHPYGHRRFETMATAALGIGLLIVGGGIAWDATEQLMHPERLKVPNDETLVIAAISILSNEWLFHYTRRAARATRSKLLLANAWHHRSDALSSVVVLIGITAVLYGYSNADALAAIIVALMVAKIGMTLVLGSLKELVDTSLPDRFVDAIRTDILHTDGVHGIHLLRTRKMGEDAFVDAHIVVNPRISVSEGHMIGDQVRNNLIARFDDIMDVLVHVDPEDDEVRELREQQEQPLSRRELLSILNEYLGAFSDSVQDIKIHYLEGFVELELILYKEMSSKQQDLDWIKKQVALAEQQVAFITKVHVLICV